MKTHHRLLYQLFHRPPRINAAGRMGCPTLAVELLLTQDPPAGRDLAHQLCQLNRERQAVEQDIFSQCIALLDQRPALRDSAIVLAGEHWHQGVVGIVASRLVERYGVPAFMICLKTAGARAPAAATAASLFSALEQCGDLLEGFGGHEQAAGFTIREENIQAFRRRMSQLARSCPDSSESADTLTVDAALPDPGLLTQENIQGLEELAPFGMGNPAPPSCWSTRPWSATPAWAAWHTRMQLDCGGQLLDAIFFSVTPRPPPCARGWPWTWLSTPDQPLPGRPDGAAADHRHPPGSVPAMLEFRLYQGFRAGDALTNRELLRLLPQRQDFVATWRYLARRAQRVLSPSRPCCCQTKSPGPSGLPSGCSRTMICLR